MNAQNELSSKNCERRRGSGLGFILSGINEAGMLGLCERRDCSYNEMDALL